ncbi:MAG: branched-chain amino acid ABC transporter permease [Anaerolineales bacterium]|nr:branched-chain amino acid ABC transporter permease [Anaerolineales bacterium]
MVTTILIGLSLGCAYALVAVGFSVVNRTTKVVNLMQGTFVMLGSMTTAYLMANVGVPYLLAIMAGLAVCAAVGSFVSMVIVYPLWQRKASGLVFMIAMFAIVGVAENIGLHIFGPLPQSLPTWGNLGTITILDAKVSIQYIFIMAAALALVVAFRAFINHTMIGRAMQACAIDRDTSSLLGISPRLIALVAFIFAGLLGGMAGIMITPVRFSVFNVGLSYGMKGFVAAALGGLGSIEGALVGGLTLGVIEAMSGLYVSTSFQDVIVFGTLILVIALRPKGIIGGGAWD